MQFLKKIPIHPTFYLLIIWFIICGQIQQFFNFALVLALHEFGHYFVAKKLGYMLERFYIAPYGACMNYKEKQFERRDEIKIALAGPVANLLFAILLLCMWWLFPNIYSFTYLLVEESLFLALFNLLPAYPLDGGRVFVAIIAHCKGRKKAIMYSKVLNVVFALIFFSLFIISWFYSFNPTFALAVVFFLSGFIQGEYNAKYKNSFLFKKKIKNFSKPKILIVNSETSFGTLLKKIDIDCYTIFKIISPNGELITLTETQVINFCINFGLNEKINNLLYDA